MADVNVLLTCAGQRVDIVRAFRAALSGGTHRGRVLVSDLDPLSPSLFAADEVVELPPVARPRLRGGGRRACAPRRACARCCPSPTSTRWSWPRPPRAIEAAGARAFLPSPEVALGCQDKWECHEMLTARGLPSPADLAARRGRPRRRCPTRCC